MTPENVRRPQRAFVKKKRSPRQTVFFPCETCPPAPAHTGVGPATLGHTKRTIGHNLTRNNRHRRTPTLASQCFRSRSASRARHRQRPARLAWPKHLLQNRQITSTALNPVQTQHWHRRFQTQHDFSARGAGPRLSAMKNA